MTLVLDRSGSMNLNQGAAALKAAVPPFIADFLNGTDHISMVSYSGNARVDVAMTTNFATPIDNAVAALVFDGATFGTGAGTNTYDSVHGPPLNLADDQNKSVTLPAGQPETKVIVYFTDGLMNTVQDTFNCGNGLGQTVYNFGGYDASSDPLYDFMDPTKDIYETGDLSWIYGDSSTPVVGTNGTGCAAGSGNHYYCHQSVPFNAAKTCTGVTNFRSQKTGTNVAFSRANITADANYRARYTANVIRPESPVPTYIYVIGLGSDITSDGCTEALLATMANDPIAGNYSCSSNPGVYTSSQVPGALLFAPDCPSNQAKCTQELTTAFQIIAAKILLRLTQ